jgi:hypothetical protein
MGGRVVGFEPDGLAVLHDRRVGLARVEIGARETEPHDRIVRHDLDHFLELLDPILIRCHRVPPCSSIWPTGLPVK